MDSLTITKSEYSLVDSEWNGYCVAKRMVYHLRMPLPDVYRREPHLWSLAAFGFAVVVLVYAISTNEVLVGFVTGAMLWFGSLLAGSEQWKNAGIEFHNTIIGWSIVLLVAAALFAFFNNKNNA